MRAVERVDEIDVTEDLWHYLAGCKRPIVLYGTGNGADKIIEALALFGMEPSDYFASDGFVRGQSFHGRTVLSYAQVCEKYENFIILVAFGTRLPEVLAEIKRLESEHELYVPDVPVVCDDLAAELFTLEYFEEHREELARVCGLLADGLSRRTFCDVILYRLTGLAEYLRRHEVGVESVYTELLDAASICRAADLGAYDGDTVRELAGFAPELSEVTALEPDARTFRKLSAFAETAPYRVTAYNAAAWSEDCELDFTSGGNRNSSLASRVGVKTGAKVKSVSARRIDSLVSECDYLKYDVEGAEHDALLGSRELIARSKPRLLVSVYHRTEDIFRLPELVHRLGYERLYLRRYEYIPAWELNLIAK